MNKQTYLLFPVPLLCLGVLLILMSVYKFTGIILLIITQEIPIEDVTTDIGGSVGIFFIALILWTTRMTFIFLPDESIIQKKMTVLGMNMNDEKIKVPVNTQLIAIEKQKKGTSYVSLVIPFRYKIKSFDIYLRIGSGLKKIVSTNHKRAFSFAENLKRTMNIDYTFQ